MKLVIIISGLLFGSAGYAQTTTHKAPSTERKVMEDKKEVQPEASTSNTYFMSKSYKDSTKSAVYIAPALKAKSKQKEQTNAKTPQ